MIGFVAHFPAPSAPRRPHDDASPSLHAAQGLDDAAAPDPACPDQRALDRLIPLVHGLVCATFGLIVMLLAAWVLIRLYITHPTAMLLLCAWAWFSLMVAGLWWFLRGDRP